MTEANDVKASLNLFKLASVSKSAYQVLKVSPSYLEVAERETKEKRLVSTTVLFNCMSKVIRSSISFVWSAFRWGVVKPNSKQSQRPLGRRKVSRAANENSSEKRATCLKRGKTLATKSRSVLVLNLIGRENGVSFLNQSRGEVKQNKSNSELDNLLKPFCDWSRKHAPPSKPIRCWSLAFSRALGSAHVLLWVFTSYLYMASWFYDIK